MVLEATIICVDNSEWQRNGDYTPTRMEAQVDAVNVLMGWKFSANPESTVGILKMAKGPEVLVTPSPDVGKVLSALHALKIAGRLDLLASVQVAQLALKHRQNKNQHQRMVLFVGSPAQADAGALTKLGQALKKNNVAVDVVLYGEIEENREKLDAFVKAANSGDNSHLVVVEPGTRSLSDALRASPLSGRAAPGDTEGASAGGTGGEDFAFGIDANEDPELAEAIRASLEEERRRNEKEQKDSGGSEPITATTTPTHEASMSEARATDDDEEAMLAEAIALSMQADAKTQSATEQPEGDLEKALRLSQQSGGTPMETSDTSSPPPPTTAESAPADASAEQMRNSQYLHDILATLPGVNPDDPAIQEILASMSKDQQDQGGDGAKKQ